MWRKEFVYFDSGKYIYLSVVFTWDLPKVKEFAIKNENRKIIVGGPAVKLMPDYLGDIKNVNINLGNTNYNFLAFHNPLATFTTKGCVNKCAFCAVPIIEGEFREVINFTSNPIICDNNILAASKQHFSKVIESLRKFDFCDFNQGIDCVLLNDFHITELQKLNNPTIRIAFDNINKEKFVVDAIDRLHNAGFKNISCYVLVGFNDSLDEATYKVKLLLSKKVRPFPMRFHPLDCLDKSKLPCSNWEENELKKFSRYYSRLNWLSKVPYEEFNNVKVKVEKSGPLHLLDK